MKNTINVWKLWMDLSSNLYEGGGYLIPLHSLYSKLKLYISGEISPSAMSKCPPHPWPGKIW